MPIQILPLELANQVAAGEIIERPVSVVKELIENSIDAGANKLNIDIEQGGIKIIRISDNGCGIEKKYLILSLKRFATSKITCFDDLENITTMGFRGEALTSISSVSRLTLTSRPIKQNEAWQIYIENNGIISGIKPVAHPLGTTVEVMDLFYNTPARRKFMRAEKIEFNNIDELIRRMALAYFNISFTLRHNGKTIRQYPALTKNQQKQYLQRLKNLCGISFVTQAVTISWKNEKFYIYGWLADSVKGNFSKIQYSYINKRIVYAKLINNAIRQAYQKITREKQSLAFILFLNLHPCQIDVNVHPSKYEIRFYQARLIYNFIYQATINALQSRISSNFENNNLKLSNIRNINNIQHKHYINKNNYSVINNDDTMKNQNSFNDKKIIKNNVDYNKTNIILHKNNQLNKIKIASTIQTNNSILISTKMSPLLNFSLNSSNVNLQSSKQNNFGRILTLYPPCYVLLESSGNLILLSLLVAENYLNQRKLMLNNSAIAQSQSLLLPLRIKLKSKDIITIEKYQHLLKKIGIIFKIYQNQLIITIVPLPLYQQNLQKLIPELLEYLYNCEEKHLTYYQIVMWLSCRLNYEITLLCYSKVTKLLIELEQFYPQWIKHPPKNLFVKLDLENAVKALII